MKNGKSCIDKKNVSLQPYTKDVKYCQIKNIDFGSATRKFNTNMMKKSKKQKIINVPEPTEKEINNFYENIHNAGESPAILSIVEPFNSKFITDNTIKVLTNLYSTKNTKLSWQKLSVKRQEIIDKLVITECDAQTIEMKTKSQYKSRTWFNYRTGRITSSNMKAVCHTNVDKPAVSIIKKICYPSTHIFSTPATQRGKIQEIIAKNQYIAEVQNDHDNLKVIDSGFHINKEIPYMGASPDVLVTCDCHGKGVLEVKCPYVYKDKSIFELSLGKNSFLTADEIGNLSLNKNHEYYY